MTRLQRATGSPTLNFNDVELLLGTQLVEAIAKGQSEVLPPHEVGKGAIWHSKAFRNDIRLGDPVESNVESQLVEINADRNAVISWTSRIVENKERTARVNGQSLKIKQINAKTNGKSVLDIDAKIARLTTAHTTGTFKIDVNGQLVNCRVDVKMEVTLKKVMP